MLRVMVAAAVLVSGASAAQATVYNGTRAVNGATATISITTDGAVGSLTDADITAFAVDISTPDGDVALNDQNAFVSIQGNDLIATPASLTYNLDGPSSDFAAFDSHQALTGFYALENSTNAFYFGPAGPGEGIFNGSSEYSSVESGDIVLATSAISAAPEPSTWLLMLSGVGAAGVMLRRARRTTGSRSRDVRLA